MSMCKKISELTETGSTVLTVERLAEYTGYKKSYIYKLTHLRQIPHFKPPFGRKVFFRKDEIDAWLTANKQVMESEL